MPNKLFTPKKCKDCPYKLGAVKCVTDPCRDCLLSKSKVHPFQFHKSKQANNKSKTPELWGEDRNQFKKME